MDTKARLISIVAISFFIGLISIVYLIPQFMYSFIFHSYKNFRHLFMSYNFYIFLDLFVLVIILFLYLYYLIRPIKTLNGKKSLTIIEMVLGGILVIFPLIGIGVLSSSFLSIYLEGFFLFYLIGLLFYCFFLIPGTILFIHGWHLLKNHNTQSSNTDR